MATIIYLKTSYGMTASQYYGTMHPDYAAKTHENEQDCDWEPGMHGRIAYRNSHITNMPFAAATKNKKTLKIKKKEDL